jgi:hypothetical protein
MRLQVPRRRDSATLESSDGGNKEALRLLSRDASTSLPIPPSHEVRFVDFRRNVLAGFIYLDR